MSRALHCQSIYESMWTSLLEYMLLQFTHLAIGSGVYLCSDGICVLNVSWLNLRRWYGIPVFQK